MPLKVRRYLNSWIFYNLSTPYRPEHSSGKTYEIRYNRTIPPTLPIRLSQQQVDVILLKVHAVHRFKDVLAHVDIRPPKSACTGFRGSGV